MKFIYKNFKLGNLGSITYSDIKELYLCNEQAWQGGSMFNDARHTSLRDRFESITEELSAGDFKNAINSIILTLKNNY